MNRNTARLVAAVVVAWLAAALGGLAAVPYKAFVLVFVAVLVLPLAITFWDGAAPRRRMSKEAAGARLVVIALERYRTGWLVLTIVLGSLAAMLNMFGGFAATYDTVFGEPVHATLLVEDRSARGRDPGEDVECVLARPDGTRIAGALPVFDDGACPAGADVMIDPRGFADPVLREDATADIIVAQCLVLGLALLSCLPAAWPRRRRPG